MSTRRPVVLVSAVLLFATTLLAQDGGVIFTGGGTAVQPEPHPLSHQIPALCRVHFQFTDDDHHVLQMRAQPSSDGAFFHWEFHDNETDRGSYYGPIEWWDFDLHRYNDPEGPFTTTEQVCSGRCTIPIPPLPPDREFGLMGFDFEYLDGDHHLLEVSVVPFPHTGRIVVDFRDNGAAPYLVRVSYLTFEKGNWRRARSRSSGAENSVVVRRAERGMKVLQGFRVRFLNGDHHLQKFEINVCGDRWLNGEFRDSGGTDDPYIFDVMYAYL